MYDGLSIMVGSRTFLFNGRELLKRTGESMMVGSSKVEPTVALMATVPERERTWETVTREVRNSVEDMFTMCVVLRKYIVIWNDA